MGRLRVVFLWHMHQPFYTDLWSGNISMPWVRLHASKSYNDMAAAIEKNPVNLAVNFTGSLLTQLRWLASGWTDALYDTARKPVDSLEENERAFVVDNSFFVNTETMIKPNPRYRELWEKRRGQNWRSGADVHSEFTNVELRDMLMCFHLAWMGWDARKKFPQIAEIEERGWDYTETDKDTVLDIGMEIAGKVLDRYRALSEKGIVEITASPFAHPILPLLVDTDAARRAMPSTRLPEPFRYPKDANKHIQLAVNLHRDVFGTEPVGMWPSEGSVSPEIIPLLAENGFRYLVTDEGILKRSEGVPIHSYSHYNTYVVQHGEHEVKALFRDTKLSDMIGFDYSKVSEEDAAADMMQRLNDIAASTGAWESPGVVTIALDGENAWENYANGGEFFLEKLYSGMNESKRMEPVQPSKWLEIDPPRQKITKIHSGSWIRSDYSVWIGEEEENDAWEELLETRRDFDEIFESSTKPDESESVGAVGCVASFVSNFGRILAQAELAAAEGSDWFWWFGDDFASDNDDEFDRLFRLHLANVYKFMGRPVPERLSESILRPHPVKADYEPVAFLRPTIDGRTTDFYEWNDGGMYTVKSVGGAMYTREIYLEKIYYGFDQYRWFLRLDRRETAWCDDECGEEVLNPDGVIIEGDVGDIGKFRIEIPARKAESPPIRLYLPDRNHPELLTPLAKASVDKCMEILIPFKSLNLKPGTVVGFTVMIEKSGRELVRYPSTGFLKFVVPDKDFEREMWSA